MCTPAGASRARHRPDAHGRPRQDQPYLTNSIRQSSLEPRSASCQTARQEPAACHHSAYSRAAIHLSTSTIAQDLRADEAPASTISHLRDCPSRHTNITHDMRRTLDLDHDQYDTYAHANPWTSHDKTRPPTDTWDRQSNKTLTLMITDSHKRNTICTLDMGGHSNCTHCGSACGYRRPSPPELVFHPIEKQQSLATNQAGQINTHSMQLGPSGDSEAPVLVPPLESNAEHRLMKLGH